MLLEPEVHLILGNTCVAINKAVSECLPVTRAAGRYTLLLLSHRHYYLPATTMPPRCTANGSGSSAVSVMRHVVLQMSSISRHAEFCSRLRSPLPCVVLCACAITVKKPPRPRGRNEHKFFSVKRHPGSGFVR